MKNLTLVLCLCLCSLFWAMSAFAQTESYNYINPETLKQSLDAGAPPVLIDIQEKADFQKHHIPGALATYAYPVKAAEERNKLSKALAACKAADTPVVIICPRGGGGAQRAYAFLKEQGIEENRLFILEKGQSGWTYPEWTEGAH